eukprot:TRINITY_DN3977_c0_g3_i1.p1 TRINITY_DN3977_c0_g3~~TRINITY_DN3977_c0_g3_i1.p1  ORF type:complete len:573 (+),score=81.49 TRINITY_DN3977_c0_g3_i1:59-1720(+)
MHAPNPTPASPFDPINNNNNNNNNNNDESTLEIPEAPPGQSTTNSNNNPTFLFSWRELWKYCGPGFLMSVAYLDPGNIEADLQAGSNTGYTLLWVLLWATLMGLILQVMAAKLGCVTGKHLAELCAEEFSKPVRILLWAMAEIAIICVDCQEVMGTAVALQILSNNAIPLWVGVLLTALYTLTFLLMDKCLRKLELVFGMLITVMSLTFGAQYFGALPPQGDVLQGTLLPIMPRRDIATAVGLIGAVIMPHNLYLHSALVLTRDIDRSDATKLKEAVYYNRIESTVALLVSFVINLFVVSVFARCRTGTDIDSKVGLANAGEYLTTCHNGSGAEKYIFAVGLLASGQAATVTSTYAGQYVMQGYLQINLPAWKRALLSRMVAIGPGLFVGLFASQHADVMQQWLNVMQSIQLPFAVLPLLYFSTDRRTLRSWTNSTLLRRAGWTIAVIIILANIYLVVSLVVTSVEGETGWGLAVSVVLLVIFGICYSGLIGWLFCGAIGVVSFTNGGGGGGGVGVGEVAPLVQMHDVDEKDSCDFSEGSEWKDAEDTKMDDT